MISGGGTGGGIYPALAAALALKAQHPDVQILWVGSRSGLERDLVERAGLAFRGVAGGPIAGDWRAPLSAAKLAWGTLEALFIVRRFRPAALLITGGWPTIPPTLACMLHGLPFMIQVPDIEPGSTIRVLSRSAARVAVIGGEAAPYYHPGQLVETGYALRPALLVAAGYDAQGQTLPDPPDTRAQARERFGLADGIPTLLVFGGSRGARSINQALIAGLDTLLPNCQIIHISGSLDWEWVQGADSVLDVGLAARYHPFEYLHSDDMALALASADLVISRAGASVLGEFPLFDLPAILVPYPHAWRYQKTNADYLVSRGAAVRLEDDRLPDELVPLALRLLTDVVGRRRMAAAASALKRPDAAARVAAELAKLAGGAVT